MTTNERRQATECSQCAEMRARLDDAEARLVAIGEVLTATGVAGDYDDPVKLAREIAAYCVCASPHPAAGVDVIKALTEIRDQAADTNLDLIHTSACGALELLGIKDDDWKDKE